jgi:hypothetical protein
MCIIALSGLLVSLSDADTFLHSPRGSNNRLNGAGANRANNNRMYNSQVSFKHQIIRIPSIHIITIHIQIPSISA